MNAGRAAQGAAALRILGLQQMALAGTRAQHFAARRNLKTLRHGFLGLNAFGTSHNSGSKRARNIRTQCAESKGYFRVISCRLNPFDLPAKLCLAGTPNVSQSRGSVSGGDCRVVFL